MKLTFREALEKAKELLQGVLKEQGEAAQRFFQEWDRAMRIIPFPRRRISPREYIKFRKDLITLMWACREEGRSLITTFRERGYFPESVKGPDCLDGETILGYVRGLYGQEKRWRILEHLASCPYCSIHEMELAREDRAAIPEYVTFIARELGLSTDEVERAMLNISQEKKARLSTVAADLGLACGLGKLPREEILRLASTSTQGVE